MMNKSRVEAITDGIIAIAATIMVLELGIPAEDDLEGLVELRHTFLAYANSFFVIYIGWLMHHDLFLKANLLSRRTFLVNGFWIFFLTLVPFTTAWVGDSPNATLPEFLYPLNLFIWRLSFQWLEYRIQKDNTQIPKKDRSKPISRALIYCIYLICMVLAFIKPILSIYVIGTSTVVMIAWFLYRKKEN